MSLNLSAWEEHAKEAVRIFWATRRGARQRQVDSGAIDSGERASVTAGKHMDGFVELTLYILRENGLPDTQVYLRRKHLALPGYFRPTKMWDVLVFYHDELIAAIEFKSQVGPSFGNNFNNRCEEAIGTAHDLWTAYREHAFLTQPRPFVGWLMLVEDAEASRKPRSASSPHFPILPEFQDASYLERYDLLCHRLMQEQLYTAAAVLTASRDSANIGLFEDVSSTTSLKNFVTELAAHAAKTAVRLQ